jgi:hypothetical protein
MLAGTLTVTGLFAFAIHLLLFQDVLAQRPANFGTLQPDVIISEGRRRPVSPAVEPSVRAF